MQGINLARRPFVNRRPVLRLAILLWIAGTGLIIHNIRQFTGHWSGSAQSREGFVELERRVAEERQEFNEVKQGLGKVSLQRENQHTAFLNQLIAFRTFPWSALFDDLEKVVPFNVKLHSVRPNVYLKAVPKKPRRKSQRRRPRPATASRNADREADAGDSPEQADSPAETEPLRRDEVALQLAGIAKDEDAVVELIEVLYDSPSFRSPFLPGELIQEGGTVKFSLSTVYLTGVRELEPEVTPAAETLVAEPPESEGDDPSEVADTDSDVDSDSDATPATIAGGASTDSERLANTGAGAAVPPGSVSRDPAGPRPASRSRESTRDPAGRGQAGRTQPGGRPATPRSRIRPRALTGSRPGAAQSGAAGALNGLSLADTHA